MPTLFEAIALANQNNLVRQQVEQAALQTSQDLFNLRDRFSSTFAFEQGLNQGLDPLSALRQAQQNSTLGGFQQLFGTGANVQSVNNGLQLQQQQIQNGNALQGILQSLGVFGQDNQPSQNQNSVIGVGSGSNLNGVSSPSIQETQRANDRGISQLFTGF